LKQQQQQQKQCNNNNIKTTITWVILTVSYPVLRYDVFHDMRNRQHRVVAGENGVLVV
jgi:stress response protein SCP2